MTTPLMSLKNRAIPLAENDRLAARAEPQQSGGSFMTYRAERVSMTSSLWSGGDWHWRLTGATGAVLADCGGYGSEAECLAVITALRSGACTARPPQRH